MRSVDFDAVVAGLHGELGSQPVPLLHFSDVFFGHLLGDDIV